MKLILLVLLLGILSCQQKQTLGVSESGVLMQNRDYRKIITENTIVFDTRSPFDFNMSKVPGSINLPISDFNASKDPLDAARRLSLYGVNPDSTVVIIGEGKGDEQKLAWEFIKLGVTHIETLKASVFRLLNAKPEGPKKNVPLWKPQSEYKELSPKEFQKKIEDLKPKPHSKARVSAFQGFPIAQALEERILIVGTDKNEPYSQIFYADYLQIGNENLFDEKGLLNRAYLKEQKIDINLRKYKNIFLTTSTPQKYVFAYALVQFGVPSLYIIH
jgi:rhodanese-related sulfurtransferase